MKHAIACVAMFFSVGCALPDSREPDVGTSPAPSCEAPHDDIECATAADCPGVDTECAHRVCYHGACGVSLEPFGTATTDLVGGDCRVAVCDGNGGTDLVFADDPHDDRNDCTIDVCDDGAIVREPQPAGYPCALHVGGGTAIGACNDVGVCAAVSH